GGGDVGGVQPGRSKVQTQPPPLAPLITQDPSQGHRTGRPPAHCLPRITTSLRASRSSWITGASPSLSRLRAATRQSSICNSRVSSPPERRRGVLVTAASPPPAAASACRCFFFIFRSRRRVLFRFDNPLLTRSGTSVCPGWSESQRWYSSSLFRPLSSLGFCSRIGRK